MWVKKEGMKNSAEEKEWKKCQRKERKTVDSQKLFEGGPALINDDIQSMCLCVYAQCSLMFASVIPVTKTKAQ
jgi:hypothetical protein